MTLEEFAVLAGVEVFNCDVEWGGRFAYRTKDHPNSAVCGFVTKNAAYKGWLASEFGSHLSKAVMKLLREAKK